MAEAPVPIPRDPFPHNPVPHNPVPRDPAPTRRPFLTAVGTLPAYRDGVPPARPRPESEDRVTDVREPEDRVAGDSVPDEFSAVAAALRAALAATRPEVVLTETRAPSKIAPHALALLASVNRPGGPAREDAEIAVGRLVLLHDPEGQAAWDGTYRIACFARADVEAEMGADPMLADVTWSWLVDALEANEAVHDALAGTVTVTRSSRFGALAEDDEGSSSEVELRCSWTPRWDADPARHLTAFTQLLSDLAGLPPDVPGVVALTARRR
jgi:hypothetical protein